MSSSTKLTLNFFFNQMNRDSNLENEEFEKKTCPFLNYSLYNIFKIYDTFGGVRHFKHVIYNSLSSPRPQKCYISVERIFCPPFNGV